MTGPLPRSGAGPRATDARAPSADASRGTPKLAPESSPAATAASGWRAGGVSERAAGLHAAFKAGDAGRAQALLDGGTAESNAALMAAYRGRYGRDLEYDLRGFASKGLSGAALTRAWQALHGPRLEQTAAALAQLTTQRPTADVRKAVYGHLALAGGEERAALAAAFQAKTGRSLTDALGPVFAAAQAAPPTFTSPPEKTVAIFVSSGNWKDVASGATDKPVGGYHWREVEGYVKEALDRGYTPVLFTPDGLPPSPDLAGDAGLWASPSDGGRWIAWMSDSSLPADRLDGGRGWVRVDGRLLERDAISANSLLTHPLNLTERNELSNATAVATGVNAANDCGDWTALSGTLGIGDPHKTSTGWASVGTNFCGPSWNIYCFEGNATTSLPPPPPIPAGGRRAFILRAALPTNTPNADQACANEATAIGFPNAANFIALRATTTASAVSRLNPDGGNWYRSDGVQLTRSPEDLIVRGELLATVDRFADGGLGNVQVMTGAASPIVPSSSVNESCVNWTAASGALIVGQTATADGRWWSDSSPAGACSGGVAYRVYCFER